MHICWLIICGGWSVSAFAATVTDLRRSQNDRWCLEQADPDSPQFTSAREESYQRRADATAALCRVHLINNDARLDEVTQAALDAEIEIQKAHDEPGRARRGERARLALDRFLSDASAQVNDSIVRV